MGDLLSPRRRDVFDRLRRRIESYRQHHVSRVNQRFDSLANGLYKQQRRDTALLHQRWLESKAKRSQKSSSSSKSSRGAGNVDPAINVATAAVEPGSAPPQTPTGASHLPHNRLKRKLGTSGTTESSTSVKVGGNTELGVGDLPDAVSANAVGRNNNLHSVSVNIVHEINTATAAHAQINNHIKLTVSSTLHTGGTPSSGAASGNLSSPSGVEGHHADTNAHPSTPGLSLPNVCKREPQDEEKCSPPSDGFPETIGIADVDELQAILDTLEKEGDITPELMKEFDLELKNVEVGVSQNPVVKEEETRGRSGNTSGNNPVTRRGTFADSGDTSATNKGSPAPGVPPAAMFPDPVYPGGSNPQNFNGMAVPRGGAARYGGARAPAAQAAQPQLLTGDTGPAAETLKQMAAQHQNLKGDVPYVPKQPMSSYRADGFTPDGYVHRMPAPHPGSGYPGYAPHGYNPAPQNGMYPAYSQQMVNGMPRPPVMSKQDPSLTYGATKPLCHYSEPMMAASMSPTNPSSLQQLQNQVQSHFGGTGAAPSPGDMRMEMGQAQHMQMTHTGQQVVMSQAQHMQYSNTGLPPGAPLSATPQQGFGGGVPGTPPAYMTEQMKMQQLYQEKMMHQHHQQQMQQSSASYMARPPPEYKVHPDGSAPNYPTQRVNPLETMQHMVNQTSPPPGGMMNSATSRASPLATGMKGNAQYPAGHPMMPSGQMAMPTPASGSHRRASAKAVGSVYTSALMRDQRPPNVNVGPEGLNISQQRGSHKANWHRPMLGGATVQMPMRPHMPDSGMPSGMHYGSYGGQQGMSHPQMQYSQQQQAAMAANAAAAVQQRTAEIADGMRVPPVHNQMAQQSTTTMMVGQQQHVHMRSAHGVITDMNMSQSISMTTNGAACPPVAPPGANASFPGQSITVAPPASASGSQFPLDFLDNPSANATNYYNEQHGGGAQDLYFMDDLFPGT